MKQPTPIQTDLSHAEETLRLLAELPAPAGLEVRVHAALQAEPRSGRVLSWPGRGVAADWRRGVAAAALVAAIAGGSWAVYSRVQPAESMRAVEMPRVTGSGGFSNAGAMRTPQTLIPPAAEAPAPAIPLEKPAQPTKKKTTQPAPAR